MKQLLFLLLFPCFAIAQYPGNAGQKITLGEQTTADGLVYRGLASDTTRKPSVDTMAYILLDTNTNIIWQYKKETNNAWTRVGGSISSGLTGVLPVANGGTGQTTLAAAGIVTVTGTGTTNYLPKFTGTSAIGNSLVYDNGTNVTIGGTSLNGKFTIISQQLSWNNYPNTQLRLASSNSGDAISMLFTDGNNTNGWFGYQDNATASNRHFYWSANDGASKQMVLNSSGNVGIGTTSPTAALHLKAGTATANTAPLKFTSGTNLTTAEAGAMEFNGTNLFFSPSTTRHTVNHGLTGSATLDFPSTTTLLSADLTITVTGAADGDIVSLGVPNAAVNANTSYSAWVSAANTVTVRFNNYSSLTVNPASGTFKVFVTK